MAEAGGPAAIRFAVAAAVVPVAPVPGRLLTVPLRADLTIVVPEDTFDEVVLPLVMRSCCLVAGRLGDLTAAAALVPGRAVGFRTVVALGLRVAALDVVGATGGESLRRSGPSSRFARARAFSIIAFRGLAGFKGETGRDI